MPEARLQRTQLHSVMVGIDGPMELEDLVWDIYRATQDDPGGLGPYGSLARIRALIEHHVDEAIEA